MEPGNAAAHRILEYLLTKAAVTGKAKKATIKIPYKDLVQDWPNHVGYENVDFILEIKTRWAPADEETLPIEVSEDNHGFDPETDN